MSPSLPVGFLQTQSDARLIALAARGHERAFEALVLRYRKPLLAHCRRMRVPAERAEDAVQQGLLQAWVALQGGAEVRDVRPWLYRIVRNAALRMIDQPGDGDTQLSESLPGADAPESELDRRLAVRETLASVAALPPLQREALIGTAVNGHSHEQVAAAMGLTDGAVRGLVYRARAALRNAASVLTPFPLVEWAADPAREGAPLSQRLAELVAGGGAAGVGSLVKGGAAMTAGLLVAGAVVAHPRLSAHGHRAAAPISARPYAATAPVVGKQAGAEAGHEEANIPSAGNGASVNQGGGPIAVHGRDVSLTKGSSAGGGSAGTGSTSGSAGGGPSAPVSATAGGGASSPAGGGASAPASGSPGGGASVASTSGSPGGGASAPASGSATATASSSSTTGGTTFSPTSADESAPVPPTITSSSDSADGVPAAPAPATNSGD